MKDDEREYEHDAMERMRQSGQGVTDPNIVGDVGPVDIPPGADGDSLIEEAGPGDDRQRDHPRK
jgi:hypothetical protein